MAQMRVAVIGNIGSGKSSLCERLVRKYGPDGARVVSEPVEQWQRSTILEAYYNVFLKRPAEDESRIMFQWFFQGKVLLDRLAEMKTAAESDAKMLIYDGHPISDEAFVQTYPKLAGLDILAWYLEMQQRVLALGACEPDLLIYISSPPKMCFEQIGARGRAEERTLPLALLEGLHAEYVKIFAAHSGVKVEINSDGESDPNEVAQIAAIAIKFAFARADLQGNGC